MATSRGVLWWAALVVPLWLVLVLCTYWEPVTRDGWGNSYWYLLHELSPGKLVAYVGENWRMANPRLGQTWTLLSYWPGPFHVIVTPLLELAMFSLLTALALGRWPRRTAADAFVALTVTALVCTCTPQIGPMLFYRPFTGNYLFGLVLNLAWLIPFRFASPNRIWLVPLMLVLGVAAGMCNEHTGIAFLAMGGYYTFAAIRTKALAAWQIAALVGLAAGYVLLLVAPGHAYRYDGLAKQASMLGRMLDRGAVANLRVMWSFIAAMLHALPWLVLGVAAKRKASASRPRADKPAADIDMPRADMPRADEPAADLDVPRADKPAADIDMPRADMPRAWRNAFVAGSVLCTLALLASPKIGGRLYLASVALASIPIASFVANHTRAACVAGVRWLRVACIVLSAGVLGYGAIRCIAIYSEVGPVGNRRMAIIRDTPNGQSVEIPRLPAGKSTWFLGEDLDERMLAALARDYGLTGITFEK